MSVENTRRWPRITIRGIMVLVFLVGIAFYMGMVAVEVYQTKEYHVHMAVNSTGPPGITAMGGMQPPFWPRYVRRLFGRPWLEQPFCGPTPGFVAEQCEFAHPEIVLRIGDQKSYHATPLQAEMALEIEKRRLGEQQKGK